MRALVVVVVAACGGGDDARKYNAGPDEGEAQPSVRAEAPTPDGDPFLHDVGFSPDGRWVLAETSGAVTVWELDAAAGTLVDRGWVGVASRRGGPPDHVDVMEYGTWLDANPQVHDWALSPDGRQLIGVGKAMIARWKLHPERDPIATLIERAERDAEIREVALSPDGGRLLVLETEQVVSYRVDGLVERGAATTPDYPGAAAFLDDRLAAVVGADFVALLGVDRDGDLKLLDQVEVDGFVESVVRLGDDRFASGDTHGAIVVWRVRDRRLERTLELPPHHHDKIYQLAAPRDGRWLAAASVENQATLWSLAEPGPPIEIALPEDDFYGLAIHPHGPWLATGGQGIRIWRYRRDAVTGSTSRR